MGFVIWLYNQYKVYRFEKTLHQPGREEQDKIFLSNYRECLEKGFSEDQLLALMNLVLSASK